MIESAVVGLAVYLLLANVLVSLHVWRDRRRTTTEKIAEIGLVWLVPFLGHLVALAISLEGPAQFRSADPVLTSAGAIGAISGA